MKRTWIATVVLAMSLGACTSAPETLGATVTSSSAATTNPPTTSTVEDVWDGGQFTELEPGTYFIDPDQDPSTPLRVTFDVPAEGWASWIGAVRFTDEGLVGVSITTVSNLVSQGCTDHSWAEPPVGRTVDELATALAGLAPFRVTSPPEEVSIDGYRGTYLEWTVPKDQPVSDDGGFIGCVDEQLMSWVAAIDTTPEDAYYGYTGPGFTEEFWIIDVEGTRIMIETARSAGSRTEDIAEMHAIVDSIRIEP